MDSDPLVAFVVPRPLAWIRSQRDRYRPLGKPIADPALTEIKRYFSPGTLERAQFVYVDVLENPPFYAELQRALPGIALVDFAGGEGITFDDTILVRKRADPRQLPSILVHELVHVSQYALLGSSAFAERYVRGWTLTGMEYESIPLERDAFELQARFDRGEPPFSIEQAVVAQLSARNAT